MAVKFWKYTLCTSGIDEEYFYIDVIAKNKSDAYESINRHFPRKDWNVIAVSRYLNISVNLMIYSETYQRRSVIELS